MIRNNLRKKVHFDLWFLRVRVQKCQGQNLSRREKMDNHIFNHKGNRLSKLKVRRSSHLNSCSL